MVLHVYTQMNEVESLSISGYSSVTKFEFMLKRPSSRSGANR